MAKRNTEIGIEAMKQWRVSHPEQVAAQMIKVNEAKKEWQIEHPEEHKKQVDEWRKAGSDANSQKIICVTTGVIYNSQCEASRQTGVPQSNISKCLKGERKFAGRDKESNEKLVWRKYEE